jgi:hypothetical protein
MPNPTALSLSDDRKRTLVGFLTEKFGQCVQARSAQIESKYTRWLDNYSGKPLETIRTTPFYRASNFVPQLIRMHTDILSARIFGLILATKPMWRINTLVEGMSHEDLEAMSLCMDSIGKFQVRLAEILDSGVYRAFKTGHCMLKGPWIEDRRWRVSGMSEDGKTLKQSEVTKSYLDLRPLAFDDVWVNPITVQYLRDARQIYHRLRLTKEQVQWRADNNLWNPAACAKVLNTPEQSGGTARDAQSNEAGIALTPDVTQPYTAVEATLDYELESGKTYEIVVVFNPKVSGPDGFLRGYYNPYERLRNNYAEIKFLPREDFIYGYSIPEILEQSQEEQAQIHNARRDSNTIGNIPTFKKKRYADQPNPSAEWYPGKVFELEAMDDMDVLNLNVSYNSMIDEEKFLLFLAEQYSGVQAPMQGYGAGVLQGKRGIYNSGGTLAMLAEGNRRLDIFLYRARYPFHELGQLIYQSYKQFRPDGAEYRAWGKNGDAFKKSFTITEPGDYPGFFFNITAADASANKEVDRTALLLMANTMAGYYRQIVEAAATVTQLPQGHPLKEVLITVLDGAKDLASRLLFSFDIGDRGRLLPDVRTLLGGSPDAGAKQAQRVGVPGSDEPVSINRLRELQENLTSVTRGAREEAGGRM